MDARRTPPRPRVGRRAAMLASGVALGLALLALTDDDATTADRPGTVVAEQPAPAPQATAGSRPVRLRVPRIGVDTGLLRLGLTARRELEVPPMRKADTAGWYDRSPVPGDAGPSVLAGHVDSRSGPAVFYRLRELRRGDRVVVDRDDGRRATFTVDRVDVVAKSAFPTRRVYGATSRPELRLITCGGTFDHATDDYLSNVVVFAHLTHLTTA
ncbi:class F sortase [Nocardioides aromaticivorans]|nr:class F sortase [Nocardioides aromaticivorans]